MKIYIDSEFKCHTVNDVAYLPHELVGLYFTEVV
jgi:hypothetical protein